MVTPMDWLAFLSASAVIAAFVTSLLARRNSRADALRSLRTSSCVDISQLVMRQQKALNRMRECFRLAEHEWAAEYRAARADFQKSFSLYLGTHPRWEISFHHITLLRLNRHIEVLGEINARMNRYRAVGPDIHTTLARDIFAQVVDTNLPGRTALFEAIEDCRILMGFLSVEPTRRLPVTWLRMRRFEKRHPLRPRLAVRAKTELPQPE